jgi:hypothetical protein
MIRAEPVFRTCSSRSSASPAIAVPVDAFYLHVKGDRDLTLAAILIALIAAAELVPRRYWLHARWHRWHDLTSACVRSRSSRARSNPSSGS